MILPAIQVLAFPASYRVVNADRAPHALIADITSYADFADVLEVISLTGVDVTRVAGRPALVPVSDWPHGEGAAWALLAFSVPGEPSRFTDGTYGIWYAVEEYDTAVAETCFHQERLMRRWEEPPQAIEKQAVWAQLSGPAIDLRPLRQADPARYAALHDPDPAAYPATQAFGRVCRQSPAALIAYHSVRRTPDQVCLAALRPNAIYGAKPRVRTTYRWDGHTIAVDPPTYLW